MKKDSNKENWATVKEVKIYLPNYRKQHKLTENWKVEEEPKISMVEDLEPLNN